MKFCAPCGIISLAFLVIGCGGGSGNNVSMGSNTTITVNFSGATPTAVATQAGNGAFTSATPAGQIAFVVPGGTTKYAVAFVCPPFSNGSTLNTEFVFEGSIMDTTSPTVNCFSQPPATGTATGNVASSSLGSPGICCSDFFLVSGSQNFGIVIGEVSHPSLSFSTPMPVGPNDIAVLEFEQNLETDIVSIIGIKIIRAQMVPGMVGGSGINLVTDDAVVTHLVTAANIPPGFSGDHANIFYNTPNGTTFSVKTEPAFILTLYAAVPAASTQPGDFYTYEQRFFNQSNSAQIMGVDMTTTNGAEDVTFSAPAPWSFTGPTPARLPAFTYSYSGFAGLPTTLFTGSIRWQPDSTTQDEITMMATPNALSSGSTLTIPDLSSIPGSLVPAASGTQIFWTADIFGGTVEPIPRTNPPIFFPPPPPPNSSGMFVENSGSYTQP